MISTSQVVSTPMSAVSASIGGSPLLAGAVASATVSVPGATVGNGVTVTPATYPGDAITWRGYVSSQGIVTVVVQAVVAGTPVAGTYNVRVFNG